MSHFAKVIDSKVIQVIVAEPDFFDTFIDSSPGEWIQTSYNGTIRKNYAGIGYTYDRIRDAFIAPQPFHSWVLVEETCQWTAPTVRPSDGKVYVWDEETINWIVIEEK
jgi:hypothetical protein